MSVEDTPRTTIEGSGTDIVAFLDEEHIEESLREQGQEMADSKAFAGSKFRLMPDAHWGAGAAIGTAAELPTDPLRVCPNTVGVDSGCGMLATKYEATLRLETERDLKLADKQIRQVVPMGNSVRGDDAYNMLEDFPWAEAARRLLDFEESLGRELDAPWFDEYGIEYFEQLCERVEYSQRRATSSVGSLGGGNHFIEIGRDDDGDLWSVIHSGSRGIGACTVEYHQDRAESIRERKAARSNYPDGLSEYLKFDKDDPEILQWLKGGKGEPYVRKEKVREDFNGKQIGLVFDIFREMLPDNDRNTDLDYLEGKDADPYLIDMIFLQLYAEESRRMMAQKVGQVLGADAVDHISSPHNLISFDDLVIRKGATAARDGEKLLIPFNMAEGTLVCKGKGNPEYLNTAPHGAGRVMSRREAKRELSSDDHADIMDDADVYASELPLDESPESYKDTDMIRDNISETVEVVDQIKPILNCKAAE